MRRRGLCFLALIPILVLPAAAPSSDRAFDTSIRQLRAAVAGRSDGGHLLLLSSLRQLRDPSLRSFYLQLAHHGEPGSQIHAILGLAEIDSSGHIDPWLVSQLDSPAARYATIDNALQLDLIDTPQIKELLGWDDLEPEARVLLLAELLIRGEPIDQPALETLAGHERLRVAGLAAGVLSQLGHGDAFSTFRSRLEAAPRSQAVVLLRTLFADVSRYELTTLLDWIADTIQQGELDPDTRAVGIATVLGLEPERGVALWARALGAEPTYSASLRYGLMLLAAAPEVGAAAFDRLPGGDPLLDGMSRAGKAVCTGQDVVAALNALADLGHPASISWVMAAAGELDHDQAAGVYTHLIDAVSGADKDRPDARAAVAFIAVSKLFQIDPGAVIARLDAAEDDGIEQQAILLGLLESNLPTAGRVAEGIKRIGFSRADSLALILIAKHAEQISPEQLQQLGVIASGGGLVVPTLEAQAAWLYLKHAAKIEQALAVTFADPPTP